MRNGRINFVLGGNIQCHFVFCLLVELTLHEEGGKLNTFQIYVHAMQSFCSNGSLVLVYVFTP